MDQQAEAMRRAEEEAKEAHGFWMQVGRTLEVWQHCEEKLCEIYVSIIQATVSDAVRASFYVINSVPMKTQMISAALSIRLEDHDINKEWSRLKKKVEDRAKDRNILAHGSRWVSDGISVMAPHFANVLARDKYLQAEDQKVLDTAAIFQLQKDFSDLAVRLSEFYNELGGHLLSFGKPINLPRGRN